MDRHDEVKLSSVMRSNDERYADVDRVALQRGQIGRITSEPGPVQTATIGSPSTIVTPTDRGRAFHRNRHLKPISTQDPL